MSRHPDGSDAPLLGRRTFVLLPGAWSGPWSWEPIRARLAELGHAVHAVAFSGLQPHVDVGSVGLQTHVNDVLATIERHDLADVILVGHSYSSLVAAVVTDQARHRIARTVYVQGFVPEHGRSLLDAFSPERKAQELADIDASGGRWPPPPAAAIAAEPDLSTEQARWLAERLVPHPARTVSEPVILPRPLADQPSTFIASQETSTGIETLKNEPHWQFRRIDAGHWPMLTIPDQLTQILVEAADRCPGQERRDRRDGV